MTNKNTKLIRIAAVLALAVAAGGCANLSHRENTVLGAVIGAGVGAAVGSSAGHDAHYPPRRVEHTRVVEVHEHHHHKVKRKHGRHHDHH